jgi:hypothetical protein
MLIWRDGDLVVCGVDHERFAYCDDDLNRFSDYELIGSHGDFTIEYIQLLLNESINRTTLYFDCLHSCGTL